MKMFTKRIISLLLAICLCVGLLPLIQPKVNAVTPNYSVSSAYKASEFYSALLDVELTGNQREDIINVALSQVGYREGNYSGDTGGENDGYYNNYTESNYWYHNYVSTDMPIGGSYAPWCATFVSWCAEMAGIPSSIIGRSTCASRHSYGFDVVFYAGGSTLYSSSDNDSRFMGYNYTPKKGDLFFTRSWSHVGLVVGVSGSNVITVEGNTNSDGSAEGDGVFRRTSRRIVDLYFGVPDYEESYLSSCTYYPAHCKIKVNTSTNINSQPCGVSSANGSVKQGTASSGQTYTATGLYRNSSGEYWYRVATSYGDASYLAASNTSYVSQITSDITLSGKDAPDAHVAGKSFTVAGTIESDYNRLDTASCYVYPGFDQGNNATTGYTDNVGGTQYVLNNSNIDYNVKFGSLTAGNYTYELSVTYTNYYMKGSSMASNTGTIKLLSEYFVVIPSSVSQSSCSHTYTSTVLGASVWTEGGTQIKACSTRGLINVSQVTGGGHSYGSWKTVSSTTCTTDGSKTRTCSVCGKVETQTVAATGHQYNTVTHAATCTQYAIYEFTCTKCGNYLKRSASELATGWIETIPSGMSASMFNTQTQYRYSNYETKTSTATSLAGYNQTGTQWVKNGTGSIKYVPSWPSGFSTSNSLYSQYNKSGSKVTPSETATAKTVVESDAQCGYLYYHWCYADSYYSVASSSGSYTTFHAYYDTTAPGTYTCDTSDMSYKTSHSTCSNSAWWFVTDVYQQDYTKYQMQYTYERWAPFSSWSATPATASSTKKVETRTVYQLKNASLAAHNYVNGKCTVCGGSDAGYTPPQSADYYLFGFINGANYACEEDYNNLGTYKFVNGKLTVTFTSDSQVAVKNGNNLDWYMTNGWLGNGVTTATLYPATALTNADKLYVPGGKSITFSLVVNSNDTMMLSYKINEAPSATPTVTPKSPSLTFKDEVSIDVHFAATDLGNLTGADLGLLTWSTAKTDGTVADAEANVQGATYNASTDRYLISTPGIPAKKLGDTVYMKLYVKLADGSYVYSKMFNYSPKTYATNTLKNSTDNTLKSLMVALLNYGAAAQSYFGYKTYNLPNSSLTAAQKALASSYSASMVPASSTVNSSKVGVFTNSGGFSKKIPAVSFDSAFSIEYFFTPSYTPSGSVTLYYWTQADYNAVSTLKASNATGRITMTRNSDGSYHAAVSGIAAKDLNQTIYVAGGYKSGSTNYCTGILPYAIGTYCASQVSRATAAKDLAAATAVYGYYANAYFNG